jgi:hypothetical protein
MKRIALATLVVVLSLPALLGARSGAQASFDLASVPPTLIESYEYRAVTGSTNLQQYQATKYRPRGFTTTQLPDAGTFQTVTNTGGYDGYDVLSFDAPTVPRHIRPDAFHFSFNRPTCVGVVWLSNYVRAGWSVSPLPIPDWMSGYEQGNNVTFKWPKALGTDKYGFANLTAPTYWTHVITGQWDGGSIVNPGQTLGLARVGYWLLFAELSPDGTCSPSATPAVPESNDAPVAGQPCPQWLHDTYVDTSGHPVWHPQIDPRYWCNYGHDHGANPGTIPVAFGEVGHSHGVTEDHFGFKIAVFTVPAHNDLPDTTATIMVHQGSTAGIRAVCARFHEVHITVTANDTGEVLFAYKFMGDFGQSTNSKNQAPIIAEACPTQAADALAAGSKGRKQFPVKADNPGGGYEPWTLDSTKLVLGTGVAGTFVANTFDPVVMLDITGQPGGPYAQNLVTGQSGTGVFLQIGNYAIRPPFTGTRWTDTTAKTFVAEGTPNAVEQYVSPRMAGKTWTIPWNKCSSPGFGKMWECGATDDNPPAEREDSIPAGGPN